MDWQNKTTKMLDTCIDVVVVNVVVDPGIECYGGVGMYMCVYVCVRARVCVRACVCVCVGFVENVSSHIPKTFIWRNILSNYSQTNECYKYIV